MTLVYFEFSAIIAQKQKRKPVIARNDSAPKALATLMR